MPSASVPAAIPARRGTQATGRPRRHSSHVPQAGAHERTTRSPGATPVTAPPTASTIPEPSCPRIIGVGRGHSPRTTWRSEPQIPTAAIRTRTSSGPGPSSSTSAISSATPGRPEERRARSHFFAAALLGLAARFFAGVRFAAGFDAVFRLSAATTSLVGTRSAMFVSA